MSRVAEAEAAAPLVPIGAPVFSARRAPTELANEVAATNLRFAMGKLAGTVSAEPKGTSCLVVSLGGETTVAVNSSAQIIPASNLKLLTTAVALETLGPDYRFTTSVAGTLNGNTIEGDLALIGGGDPMLAAFDYENSVQYRRQPATQLVDLVQQLQVLGVTRITGNLIADESRYDTERFGKGWTDSNKGLEPPGSTPEAGPLSALMVNETSEPTTDGRRKPAGESAPYAAAKFIDLLRIFGIEFNGEIIVGASGPIPVIASIPSAPLRDIAAEALLNSDDNTAELLLKEIGLQKFGRGTSADGAQAVVDQLTAWNISTTGMTIVDGSGLSSENRLTCDTIIEVLQHLGPSGPIFDGLPVASCTGTLGPLDDNPTELDNPEMFLNTGAAGVLRAKTGTLGRFGAKGLSGYFPLGVTIADGQPMCGLAAGAPNGAILFSLIGNVDAGNQEFTEAIVLPWWRDLAEALSAFQPGPSPDDLAPLQN